MSTKNDKNRITKDWLDAFPNFSQYKPMWLLKRNGPILTGIALEICSDRTVYQPIFHIHNLCRPYDFVSLTLWNPLPNRRNSYNEFVKLKSHGDLFEDIAERFKLHAPLTLVESLGLCQILAKYRDYQKLKMPSSSHPIPIFEDMLSLLTFCERKSEAKRELEKMITRMKSWEPYIFERDGGFEVLCSKLEDIIESREKLLRTYEEQVELLKIGSLKDYGFECEKISRQFPILQRLFKTLGF